MIIPASLRLIQDKHSSYTDSQDLHDVCGYPGDLCWNLSARAGDTAHDNSLTERAHDEDDGAQATTNTSKRWNKAFSLLLWLFISPNDDYLLAIITIAKDDLESDSSSDDHYEPDDVVDDRFERAELGLLATLLLHVRVSLEISEDNFSMRPLLFHLFTLYLVRMLEAKGVQVVFAEEEGCDSVDYGEVCFCTDVSMSKNDHEDAVHDEAQKNAQVTRSGSATKEKDLALLHEVQSCDEWVRQPSEHLEYQNEEVCPVEAWKKKRYHYSTFEAFLSDQQYATDDNYVQSPLVVMRKHAERVICAIWGVFRDRL